MSKLKLSAIHCLAMSTFVSKPGRLLCFGVIGAIAAGAQGAETTINNQPLATSPTVQAKPNLLFILDDSGSMGSAYMPDDMSSTGTYGYKSAQCNGVAYDPSISYALPLKADKTSYPNASFTAALNDGYDSTSGTTNLTNQYYYTYSGSQPKMGWTYTTAGVVSNTFYNECMSTVGNSPGSGVFTKVTLTSATSATIQQNYANWYSYYRKRYLLMRTAMGRAIAALDNSYRVGFSTISDTGATDGTNYFRDVKDFDSTQKSNFYSSLYSATPNSYTPLRAALAKAGRYYANKASGQTYDPMQYACQRNYALLSTDGYWNTAIETSTYGPFVVNANTAVGNQDNTESRPMRDASSTIVTTTTPYTATAYRDAQSNTQSRNLTWTRTLTNYAATKGTNGCSSSKFYKTVQTQTYVETQTQSFLTPQQTTYSYNNVVVKTDGTVTSNTNSTATAGTWVTKTGASTSSTTSDTGAPTGSTTFTAGSTATSCSTSTGTNGYSTPTSGSWSSWSPSLTYTYSTPTIGSYSAGTSTSNTTYSGGSSSSLADVAEYYWSTDLRNSTLGNCTSSSSGSSTDVCSDIVRPAGTDTNTAQHMSTFTIGLGTGGTLAYDKNYPTQTSGDYVDLTNGTKQWPNPSSDAGAVNIDDLWHAAVNGRGRYYSALSATDLSEAIQGVVTSVQSVAGAAAAAATSTLELVPGDSNQIYSASYTTQYWTGDLQAFAFNGSDASIASTATWSAQAQLDATSYSSRKIYFNGSSGLTLFTYSNLNSTQQGYFNNFCTTYVGTQCSTLSSTDLTLANSGTNLVNYLRGDRTYEIGGASSSLFRKRNNVLGDIINAAPVYVGKPPFNYGDTGYGDFYAAQKSRKPMVYIAANDGMLHAFSADTSDGGQEKWAFIPSAVMPNMYKLADSAYGNNHQYFVDGAPVIGDIKVGSTWKTILVGGLNRGGKSYYALDITNPTSPVMLWEFTDTNMGYTYGNPVITKRQDGTWVVAVTSGLNNTTGDGKGHFYLLNAATGAKLLDINTNVGSTTTPSGLAKINAWVDDTTDNTALRFYGGDMLGNVWRFDIDNRYLPNQAALKLAVLQTTSTTPQPITTKPVTILADNKPVVIVGTGRYLGTNDITDTQQQSIYAIRDPLTNSGWGDVRLNTSNFTTQTFTLNTSDPALSTSATVSNNRVDWTKGGWMLDLPHSKERVAVNMGLQLGTLTVGTAIPSGDACASGGSSWRYYLSASTGTAVTTLDPPGIQWSPNTLIVGISFVKDANGNLRAVIRDSDGTTKTEVPPTGGSSGGVSAHRTSWRELVD